jgi:hypothetical protein
MEKTPGGLFQDFKSWLFSKTVWGIVIAVLPVAASLLAQLTGYFFDYVGIAADIDAFVELLDSAWAAGVTLVGGVIAVWGRFKAKFKIK